MGLSFSSGAEWVERTPHRDFRAHCCNFVESRPFSLTKFAQKWLERRDPGKPSVGCWDAYWEIETDKSASIGTDFATNPWNQVSVVFDERRSVRSIATV